MGNRAIVKLTDSRGDEQSTAVYLHWGADNVRDWLKAAAPNMRKGNASYAAARFIGYCHEHIPGGLSLGVMPGSAAHDPENGLYIVDCETGRVTLFREGRSGDLARSGRPFTIKLGQF